MRGISSYDSSSISMLFSSLGSTGKSANSGLLGINLSDYASIRSGSYSKLVKSYYKLDSNDTKTSSKDKTNTSTSTSTSKDSAKTLANIESAAEELTASAKELYSTKSNSVFSKKADGNYDTDKIYEKVSSFVEDYNSLLTTSAKSSASRIENSISSMKNLTSGNRKDLAEIGINEDAKTGILSIDKNTFKNADMSKVKDLFHGTGSYAYGVATRSSLINSYAQTEAARANTYGKTGTYNYNYNSGNIFSDVF